MPKIYKDQIITVEFSLKVPEDCTQEQLQEWLDFELNATCSMKHSPLSTHELEAEWGPIGWRYKG